MKKKVYFSAFYAFLILVSYFFLAVFFGEDKDVHALEEPEHHVPEQILRALEITEGQDLILAAYRDENFQEFVLSFFQETIGYTEIVEAILYNASVYDVSPALAFALCAEESAYNPQAFNRNRNDSVDRGLFQLNSSSFPSLSLEEFYDIDENARYGISHLRWCLDTAGSEVAGLAIYNAGATRVGSAGTPKSTLDYISRILKRQRMIEELFQLEYDRIINLKQ